MNVRILNNKIYFTIDGKVLLMLTATADNIEKCLDLRNKLLLKSKELKKPIKQLALSELVW